MEERYALTYDKDTTGHGNVAISELVKSVALDSHKHAGLYRAIAEILKGPLLIEDGEFDQLEASLKKHIEIEKRMISRSSALLKDEEDPRVHRILQEIHADEIRHHSFLKTLLEIVLSQEIISGNDLWDLIWRDVPTHGAPRDPHA